MSIIKFMALFISKKVLLLEENITHLGIELKTLSLNKTFFTSTLFPFFTHFSLNNILQTNFHYQQKLRLISILCNITYYLDLIFLTLDYIEKYNKTIVGQYVSN